MEIKDANSMTKTDVAELVEISKKNTPKGSEIVRLKCKVNGADKWYSNWRSVFDATGFDAATAQPGDKVEVTYVERKTSDGFAFNNFTQIKVQKEQLPF